jgi:ABC-type amino acid transport substrate-binding protein
MRRLAVALILLGALAQPARSSDLPEIKQRGKLIAIVAGYPEAPGAQSRFLARQGTELVGIEGEILAGFARQQKLELEIVYVASWETLVPSLLAQEGRPDRGRHDRHRGAAQAHRLHRRDLSHA